MCFNDLEFQTAYLPAYFIHEILKKIIMIQLSFRYILFVIKTNIKVRIKFIEIFIEIIYLWHIVTNIKEHYKKNLYPL